MALVLQASDGSTVPNANAYVSLVDVRAFALERGVSLESPGVTDAALTVAIIKATDFIDTNYSFVGYQLYRTQGTKWPRHNVGTFLHGLPPALVKATCLLVMKVIAGTATLMPSPTLDPSGLTVAEVTNTVGPISTTKKFAVPSGGISASAIRPVYTDVDLTLRQAGLIGNSAGGQVVRG